MPFGARPPFLNTKTTKIFHKNRDFSPKVELKEKGSVFWDDSRRRLLKEKIALITTFERICIDKRHQKRTKTTEHLK